MSQTSGRAPGPVMAGAILTGFLGLAIGLILLLAGPDIELAQGPATMIALGVVVVFGLLGYAVVQGHRGGQVGAAAIGVALPLVVAAQLVSGNLFGFATLALLLIPLALILFAVVIIPMSSREWFSR